MAVFIKGNEIPNASAYRLLKKVNDSDYQRVATKIVHQNLAERPGYMNPEGKFCYDLEGAYRSNLVDISELPSEVGLGIISGIVTHPQIANIAFLAADTDNILGFTGEAEGAMDTISGDIDAGWIKSIAPAGTRYIVFSTYSNDSSQVPFFQISLGAENRDINFRLDDYPDAFSSAETYKLVVQAVGDGETYKDSDPSNEIEYTPEW